MGAFTNERKSLEAFAMRTMPGIGASSSQVTNRKVVSLHETNWSIFFVTLAIYMPTYEAIASVPIERALLIEQNHGLQSEAKWTSYAWAPIPMGLSLLRIIVNVIFPVLCKKSPHRVMFYLALALVYSLFIFQIMFHKIHEWISSATSLVVYSLALFMIQARLHSLIFKVGDQSMWIMDRADGVTNLLSILLLFNWLTLEYIDRSDIDNKFQSIPIAFKAVIGTFLGVVACISVSKLRNSAFMQTERQLFKSDEIESQRSSLVS